MGKVILGRTRDLGESTDVWGNQSGGHVRVVGFGLRMESWGRKKGADSSRLLGQIQ